MQPTSDRSRPRYFKLEGTHNFRDIGGYPTMDGFQTRWGVVFRSAVLSNLPSASQQALLDLGVRTVIDLRRPSEVQDAPSIFAGSDRVNYFHIPLIEEENLSNAVSSLQELYFQILKHSQKQIIRVLEAVLTKYSTPLILNCTGGKDRTGIIIALLLGVAGVAPETIADDYALSQQYLTTLYVELRAKAALTGYDTARFEAMLGSEKVVMLKTLEYLKEEYGSVRHYLLKIGMTQAQIEALRQSLV